MKVTLLFSKYITDSTGASAVMRCLKEGKSIFRVNKVSIDYFTRDDIYPKKDTEFSSNDKKKLVGLKAYIFSHIEKFCNSFSVYALLHMYIRSGRAAKILVSKYLSMPNNDDIVFCHEIETCYYFLKYRDGRNNAKVILVSHTNGELYGTVKIDYPCLKRGIFKKYLINKEKYVLSKIDRLGFVSESSMENFKKNNKEFSREKLFFSLNGIPDIKIEKYIDNFCPKYRICCVATVNERKGQRFIIEAMMSLPRDILEKIHVNIIGDGCLKEELCNMSMLHGIERFVTFWGNRKDIPNLLSQNNIFILPSVDEGLPISIIEAMRQSLPIVSTKVGGIPEMIEEKVTGIFIDPSTEGVKSFFINMDKYDWREMGENSRRLYENKFSIESMIDTYSNIFLDLT
jgi:glycosyltransferase involved in cell wall biosynthesis